MEQPCYKCGQAVEEGVPFCPHCMAPQIRVVVAEPVPQAAVSVPAAIPAAAESSASPTVPLLALPMQWSQALRPCALAAVVASVLMSLGLNPYVSMFSVGFLGVIFYRQRRSGTVLNGFFGARLGALSGVFCFVITALLAALAATLPDFRAKFREQLLESAQKFAASHPGFPALQAQLEQLKTPEGLVQAIIVGSIVFFVLSVLLAGLGGALGGAILGRRDKS